jgi:O-antigen/teichoic acid export membrane protein
MGHATAMPPLCANRIGYYARLQNLWRLASGPSVIALVDQAIVSGSSFASTVIVARWTLPTQLGIYSIGISLLVASVTIQEALISLPYTIQRHQPVGTPAEYAGSFLMQSGLLSALLVLVLAAVSVALQASGVDHQLALMTWALVAITPFALLRDFSRRFAFAHLRLRQAVLVDGAVATIQLGTLCWFGWSGWMSSATACLALGAACAPTALMWVYLSRREFSLQPSQLRRTTGQSWSLGKWLFGSQIALLVQGYVANWLLALIAGTAATGIYAACMSVVSIANPLILGISNILTPRAVLALKEGGDKKLWRQAVQDALLLAFAMSAFCIAIIIAGQSIMLKLYHDPAFENREQILTVLAAALLASSVGMPATNALAGLQRTREIFWTISVAAVVTVLVVSWLTSGWGLTGAAYGFLLGNIVGTAGRWTALSRVLWLRDLHRRPLEKMKDSSCSNVAQAMQVVREWKGAAAERDWSVKRLDEGEQAEIFVAEPRSPCPDVRTEQPVVIKIYKSSIGSRAELACRQFNCLSRSHALLGGRTIKGWQISAPVPLHISRSPVALVMTLVRGRKASWYLRAGGELTREIVETAPEAIVAAVNECWAAGQSHGDFNIDNILLDHVTREISLVDLDVSPLVPHRDDANGWPHATHDLAYMLYSSAIWVKHDIFKPRVHARKLMFAERLLRAFVATIPIGEDKMRVLDEIHACTLLHLKAIQVSWLPQGHWRRLLRRNAARTVDISLARLKRESICPKKQPSPEHALEKLQ